MKTIFCQLNKIHISDKTPSIDVISFVNPSSEQLKEILTNFMSPNLYEVYLIGDIKRILRKVKSFFKNIKAAGGLVINSQSEILLIKRLGVWDLPKGKLESDETKKEGAIREVQEECGLTNIEIVKKLSPTYHVYPLKKNWILKTSHWFLMNYSGNETPVPQKEENIEEVIWVRKENFSTEQYPVYPAIEMVLHQYLFPSE